MPAPDGERLATLETQMSAVMADVASIKTSVAGLNTVAQRGGGAFHAILLLGGFLGWLIGIFSTILTIVSYLRPH